MSELSGVSVAPLSGTRVPRRGGKVTFGGEVEYYRAYDALTLSKFAGDALFVGPTLHFQFTSKILLSLAYSQQVVGHAVGDDRALDLADFTGNHANMKFEVEF